MKTVIYILICDYLANWLLTKLTMVYIAIPPSHYPVDWKGDRMKTTFVCCTHLLRMPLSYHYRFVFLEFSYVGKFLKKICYLVGHLPISTQQFLSIFTISSRMIQRFGQFLLLACLKKNTNFIGISRKIGQLGNGVHEKTFSFCFQLQNLESALLVLISPIAASQNKWGDEKVCLQNASICSELNLIKVC